MALTQPRSIFGVHSITAYNRTTGIPYGIGKCLGSFDMGLQGDLIELNGGSQNFPWAVENGLIKTDIKMLLKEYPNWAYELFLGKAPTEASPDSSGTVSALVNKKGTSVFNASTGVATVTVTSGDKADLKFTKYLIVCVGAAAVDVYAYSDADFGRGTDGSYTTDLLKIAANLTIVASSATAMAAYGLDLNGGSGTIGMTTGDSAIFEVKPPSTRSMSVVIGAAADTYPEFGCIAMAQKRGNHELFEVELYRCKGIGLPIGFKEKAFSEASVAVKAFYDSAMDAVAKIRHITEDD